MNQQHTTPPALRRRHADDAQWIEGWGRLGAPVEELKGERLVVPAQHVGLSRGLGRSYGDSSIPPLDNPRVLNTTLADRMLGLSESGLLSAEAGLSLKEMNRLLRPRGWFTPVTPGTQFVTLGGMVASDVHGKNHHVNGCIGEHVRRLRMMVADGRVLDCSPTEYEDLFWATVGGMGLTGHILEVDVQLEAAPSPWIYQESERVPDIDAFIDALKRAAPKFPMTVGWIDCVTPGASMGRGILMSGRWAEPGEAPSHYPATKRPLTLPDVFPNWMINPLTIRAFNILYYWKHFRKTASGVVHPDTFFYPLDFLLKWNRIYGRRGFTQYQCVLPDEAGKAAVREYLDILTRRGGASFLCVIKDCGPEGQGMLSFPMKGTSIALDVAMTSDTQGLVDEMNEFVIAKGGRIYLTKDTLTRPEHFAAMEPRLAEFLEVKRKWDPDNRFRSAQGDRLFGHLISTSS